MLQIIDSGKQTARSNMTKDKNLLYSLDPEGSPILHLYEWEKPSITYGHFIKIERFFDSEEVEKMGVEMTKRPTGGGVVYHMADYAFSFLLPSTHPEFSQRPIENYAFVHSILSKVIEKFFQVEQVTMIPQDQPISKEEDQFFCMVRPTKYDLLYKEQKIAGAAQRKRKEGYLHQGTISLSTPSPKYLDLLKLPHLKEEMRKNSYTPIALDRLPEARKEIKELLIDEFSRRFL